MFAGADQGYLVTVDQLEAARTERTKVLLFVSPSNPTGAVYSAEQTRAIGEWALEHGIWVVSDEIYQNLTYDEVGGGPRAVSIVEAVPGLAEPDDPRQRRRQDLRDDRLAPRLDGRPCRRHQGRREPAVAPLVERVEHLAACRDRRAQRPAGRRRRDAAGLRPPSAHDRRRTLEDRRRHRADAAGRVLRVPRRHRAARPRVGRRHPRPRRSSSPTSSSSRPTSQPCRARPSARAGTCA